MNRNCGKVFFKIPTDIAAGNYLIRAEVIALHTAGGLNGAQVCIQSTPPISCH
jgi:cellulase